VIPKLSGEVRQGEVASVLTGATGLSTIRPCLRRVPTSRRRGRWQQTHEFRPRTRHGRTAGQKARRLSALLRTSNRPATVTRCGTRDGVELQSKLANDFAVAAAAQRVPRLEFDAIHHKLNVGVAE